MTRGFRGLIPLLLEPVPDPSGQAVPGKRLTRLGQTLLAAGVGGLGLVTYLTTWTIGMATAASLQFCPVLGSASATGRDLDSLPLNDLGDTTNLLVWNYRLNRELIKELEAATRPQKLLLNQQIASLTIRLSRQCYLARYYRVQAGALTTVSTAAAVLLVIAALVRVPRGFDSVSRCEQAVLLSSLSMLVLSIGFLSLGSQQQQARSNLASHQKGIQLLSMVRSSLANDQLLLPADPKANGPESPPVPLVNQQAVAQLATRIEVWLLSVDVGSVALNNAFARQTFDHLFQSPGQPTQPMNPLLGSP